MIQFFKNHWFKTTFVAILLYFAYKKDFSFHFNMNNKAQTPKEITRTKYTEQVGNTTANEFSIFDIFSSSNENTLTTTFNTIDEKAKVAFVKRFGKVAREEQARYGIPASLILATALAQSHVGQRLLASEGNNYFGLRCVKNSNQKSQTEDDRAYRIYPNAWESFRDHSIFLQTQVGIKSGNYKIWIAAIGKKFNTGDEYTSLLTNIIENYGLNKLD